MTAARDDNFTALPGMEADSTETHDQVYAGVATWIEDLYNPRRIHTSLGGKSPIAYELHQAACTTAASPNRQQLAHRHKVVESEGI